MFLKYHANTNERHLWTMFRSWACSRFVQWSGRRVQTWQKQCSRMELATFGPRSRHESLWSLPPPWILPGCVLKGEGGKEWQGADTPSRRKTAEWKCCNRLCTPGAVHWFYDCTRHLTLCQFLPRLNWYELDWVLSELSPTPNDTRSSKIFHSFSETPKDIVSRIVSSL